MRFTAGLIIGIVIGGLLGAGGVYLYLTRAPAIAPTPPSVPAPAPAKPPKKKRTGVARDEPQPAEPPELTEADLRMISDGDALRAAPTTLDLGATGEGPRDLTQEEIDGAFARRAQAIISCITTARGAAPVAGRVVAGVVVGADGRVNKSRVEAPAWLVRHGLGGCARRELEALRFPAAGKEIVVTVPFDISE